MINALFLQIQKPSSALTHALEIYFPTKEDVRVSTKQYNSLKLHTDLPGGPYLSGNLAFKSEADSLIVAGNLQKEIDKYVDNIGSESLLSVQTRYHDEGDTMQPEIKQQWFK